MCKVWLLLFPILCCLLSCDALSTGGNPSEGASCRGISKKNAYSYRFIFELNCPYEEKCKTGLGFLGGGVGDSLNRTCFAGYELKLETSEFSRTVRDNKIYLISLSSENHAQFSLIDEDDVEKKYDIDLSSIINSYTVRGDSIDVHVMENCNLQLLFCSKEIVYGSKLRNGEYTFSANEGCDAEYSYDCIWHNQSSLETDDLDIHAMIRWK